MTIDSEREGVYEVSLTVAELRATLTANRATERGTEMQRWEYQVVVLPHTRTRDEKVGGEKVKHIYQQEASLNEYGSQGWEVVGRASIHDRGDRVAGPTADAQFKSICVLKRPIPG